MESAQRSLRRAMLRECRRLGADWTPSPPASDLLWGRGFQADPTAPHPLLARLVPEWLHESLTRGHRPFAPWLRDCFRESYSGGAQASRQRGDVGSLGKEQDALQFLQRQRTLATCVATAESSGMRLDAVSGYLKHDSATGKHVFVYNMRFTNIGQRRLRVLSRQYDFRESTGDLASQIKPEQPEAAGVVGFTPLVEPGRAFEFGSGVALNSPRGSLTGRFLVMLEPELSGEDLEFHKEMEKAELMLRLVYYKGLETPQFYLPLKQLHFSSDVQCIQLALRNAPE